MGWELLCWGCLSFCWCSSHVVHRQQNWWRGSRSTKWPHQVSEIQWVNIFLSLQMRSLDEENCFVFIYWFMDFISAYQSFVCPQWSRRALSWLMIVETANEFTTSGAAAAQQVEQFSLWFLHFTLTPKPNFSWLSGQHLECITLWFDEREENCVTLMQFYCMKIVWDFCDLKSCPYFAVDCYNS